MLELAGRECFILSDADKVAIEHQKNYEGYGKWVRYDELISDNSVVTSEDFIKPEAFRPSLKRIRSENPSLPDLPHANLDNSQGRLGVIQNWLETNGIDKVASKSILNTLKDDLILNLKPSHIETKYFELLEQLNNKL